MRTLLCLAVIVVGVLACAYGSLIWVSIPRSDTATGVLLAYGLMFVAPGLGAVGFGTWLARRATTRYGRRT